MVRWTKPLRGRDPCCKGLRPRPGMAWLPRMDATRSVRIRRSHARARRGLHAVATAVYGAAGTRLSVLRLVVDGHALWTDLLQKRKMNLSQVFAGQQVGVKQVDDRVWLVSFMHYDLGY